MSPEWVVIIIAGIVVVLCLIGLVIVWISLKNEARKKARRTWNVTLLLIIVMMLIIGFSLPLQSESYGWLGGYLPFLLVFLFMYLNSLFGMFTFDNCPILRAIWNPRKGLGGGAFGDFANTVGVLAGVGAYQLSQAGEGWFWLGQFAAFLAALVGLNLGLRWIREPQWIVDDRTVPCFLCTHWWSACGNFAVGAFTFLAIISQSAQNTATVVLLRSLWLFGIQMVLLLFPIWILTLRQYFLDSGINTPPRCPFYFLCTFISILVLGAIACLIIFQNNLAPSCMNPVFGIAAMVAWISMELGTIIKISHTVYDWKDLLKLIRSLDIVIGNLALIAVVCWVATQSPTPTTYEPGQWFLFCGAIVLAVHATVGGIMLSAHDVVDRRQQEEDARQAARPPMAGAIRVIPMSSPAATPISQTPNSHH
jgi:hypothetical protein